MDKSWMKLARTTKGYKKGLKDFLDFASANSDMDGMILCPCKTCKNSICMTREDVEVHLRCEGFINGYTKWIAHGEHSASSTCNKQMRGSTAFGNMAELLQDAFGILNDNIGPEVTTENREEVSNPEAAKFYKLVADAKQELYSGYKKHSRLSFLLHLLHLKSLGKMSNKAFNMQLQLIRETFSVDLPKSYYEARKLIKELGLGYDKYDACPNDCTLYWGEAKDYKTCSTCKEPRWETSEHDPSGEKRKVARKVLWHFPLKPRLQRLFMSSKTVSFMRWHAEERTNDGCLRHPADSPAWQFFDHKHPQFATQPRNVRLGLASDGFNPFNNMSVSHSTWPVVLVPYNLPPWMCMKQPYFMLSLLISGPTAPGNNIDVYLQPLIAELLDLWDVGVTTYDASLRQNFQMRAALLWTISDFPGYACLSGWSTKGKLDCPVCNKNTCSLTLKNGGKQCYMGHRRFLKRDHPFRNDAKSFDGTKEHGDRPCRLRGDQILEQLNGFEIKFGKEVKDNPKLPFNWKKRSIFFKLPYWKDNLVPHNLDVMHIVKNVGESILSTLMNVEGKSKDNIKSRQDLKEMGIRPQLHPAVEPSGKNTYQQASFVLDKKEKLKFCSTLKKVRVPDGYASNISRCVHLKPPRIFGFKSHDYHIFMLQLLPLSLRKMLPKAVRVPLVKLSRYFRELCSKVLKPNDLVKLEEDIAVILCQLKRVFPPSFFDIMEHLCVHLATEARLAGPVHYRWMYPIERYLCTLKSYVRNRARPEGSIAEGYLADECLSFCSLYLDGDVESKFNRPSRNDDNTRERDNGIDVFSLPGRPFGKGVPKVLSKDTLKRGHQYILFNCEAVKPYIEHHHELVKREHSRASTHEVERIHSETFAHWFSQAVQELPLIGNDLTKEDLKCLAQGPNLVGIQYDKCFVNGFRFHTKELEKMRKTQNSGVVINATTSSFSSSKDKHPVASDMTYYGILNEIIELDYTNNRKVILFGCDWVSKGRRLKQDEDGFVLTNFSDLRPHNEPFILASQAKQVFYVEDPFEKGWQVAIVTAPRDYYDMDPVDNIDMYLQSTISTSHVDDPNEDMDWVREDAEQIVVRHSIQ